VGRASRRRSEQRAASLATPHVPEPFSWPGPSDLPLTTEQGLARLAALRAEQHQLERLVEQEVARLVRLGVGWGDVGRALGVSRQGARQRFGSRGS
jgi:hypothetical protein